MTAVKWNRDRASITIDRRTVTLPAADVTLLVNALNGGSGVGDGGTYLPTKRAVGELGIEAVHPASRNPSNICVWVGELADRFGHIKDLRMVQLTPAERDTLIAQLRSGGNR